MKTSKTKVLLAITLISALTGYLAAQETRTISGEIMEGKSATFLLTEGSVNLSTPSGEISTNKIQVLSMKGNVPSEGEGEFTGKLFPGRPEEHEAKLVIYLEDTKSRAESSSETPSIQSTSAAPIYKPHPITLSPTSELPQKTNTTTLQAAKEMPALEPRAHKNEPTQEEPQADPQHTPEPAPVEEIPEVVEEVLPTTTQITITTNIWNVWTDEDSKKETAQHKADSPKGAEKLLRKAHQEFKEGKLGDCQRTCDEIVEKYPGSPTAQTALILWKQAQDTIVSLAEKSLQQSY